jgi:hypothetical protein
MFCGQLDYNLLFLWFLDMHRGKPGFDLSGIGSPGWWSPRLKPQSGALTEHDVAGELFRTGAAELYELRLTSPKTRAIRA